MGDESAPLAPPGNLVAVVTLDPKPSVTLQWRHELGSAIAEFKIGRTEVGSKHIATGWTARAEFADDTVVPGKTYIYNVIAFDGLSGESPSSPVLTVVVPALPPATNKKEVSVVRESLPA